MSKPHSEQHPAAVGRLLEHPAVKALSVAPEAALRLCREEAQRQREGDYPTGDAVSGGAQRVAEMAQRLLAHGYPKVLNGTGILLHTGLGRAPLAAAAVEAMRIASGSCLLEIDIATGSRGDRWAAVERKLTMLTGGEAALVTNNCAAAVLLALHVVAARREVIVARGELVEIGGGFRMPDVMARAGVKRIEVGTTNRVRLSDYEAAITPRTAALLRVHPSNYRIVGFTEQPPLKELAALAHRVQLPLLKDLGNGLLFDLATFGLPSEPTINKCLSDGVDLLAVSGDKCLGGPQAGILLGRLELIQRCRRNPLLRAIRPDKLTLAALDATLALWLAGREGEIPFIRMMSATVSELNQRAISLLTILSQSAADCTIEIVTDEAMIGSGAAPQVPLADVALRLRSRKRSAAALAQCLRTATTPLFAVVKADSLHIHLRSILLEDDALLYEMLSTMLARW